MTHGSDHATHRAIGGAGAAPAVAGRTRPPGPPEHWLYGSALAIRRDPLGYGLDMFRQYGNVVSSRFLIWPQYMVFHPSDVKRVLQEHHQQYSKDTYLFKFLRPVVGLGLFTNDGQSWLHQRRLMQPAFHRQHLAAFATIMTGAAAELLEGWHTAAREERPLDISREMTRLTLRVVGQALFSVDLTDEADSVSQAFTALLTPLSDYLFNPVPPLGVPTPRNRRIHRSMRDLDSVVHGIIAARRSEGQNDLVTMLLAARDAETGKGMSDKQVRDEVMTLLLAGHETTANLLTWTWYLLAQHPEAERRLRAELAQVLGGRIPTVEDLPRLTYTTMVLEESLRLYPPAVGFNRKALAEDELGGYRVPANTLIWLSPHVTHRHPEFWDDPEAFDPERFAPERVAARPHFAYFPFGGGPRQCIGNNFAMMETQLVLATIAQRYQLRLVPGHPVEPQVLLAMRPRDGLLMTLDARPG
jgi:cytochrome P450